MMFEGSENVGKGEHMILVENNGGDMNGSTSEDRTNYFESFASNQLDLGLFLESDRMRSLAVNQANLDNQRNAVQEERRLSVDNQPYGVTRELITKNTYPAAHPYSWTTIGEMADLDAASMSDVQEWFKTYYGPSNVVIVIAGDIDATIAKEKVEKYFGDIPAGPPVAHQEVWIAKMTGTHREVVQDRNFHRQHDRHNVKRVNVRHQRVVIHAGRNPHQENAGRYVDDLLPPGTLPGRIVGRAEDL